MHAEGVSEAASLIGVGDLPGVPGRDRRDEVRIHDPTLHQIQRRRVEVIAQPLVVEVSTGVTQAGRSQDRVVRDPLVAEVVHREANPLLSDPDLLVNLVQKNWDECSRRDSAAIWRRRHAPATPAA